MANQRPSILIVGAGIGGLTLGALLEKAGVPYLIFERSATLNPIGSAIALGSAVMPMFKQLGIYDQLKAMSKPNMGSRMYSPEGKLLLALDFHTGLEEKFSFEGIILPRPALYDLLLAQIPTEKIQFSKKLLSYKPTEQGVMLSFSDNSSIEGSLLVGADGANSSVRQNMFKILEKTEEVPASDKLPLKYSSISLVGQTQVLDPALYPLLQGPGCLYETVLAENKPFFSVAFPTLQNTICWMVIEFLDKESSKIHDNFRTSEWGPEAAEEMAKREDVREAKFPGLNGASIGDIVALTPKTLMSKVMLEEKVFKTWTHERAVLLGDACHKMTPAAGLGALNAMLDSLVLANHIEALKSDNLEEIKAMCMAYKKERYASAKGAVDASATTALLTKSGMVSNVFRKFMHNVPGWIWDSIMSKAGEYRPQAAFLPRYDDKGTVKPLYQPSLHLPGSTRPTGPVIV